MGEVISYASFLSFLALLFHSSFSAFIKSVSAPLFCGNCPDPILLMKDLCWSDAADCVIFLFRAIPTTLASEA